MTIPFPYNLKNMDSNPTSFMDWNLDTAYSLIILDDSGSACSAQTGGVICNQRTAKGWHVPLNMALGLNCDFFHAWVCRLVVGNADESERNRVADVIDSVFSNSLYAFKVDRARLHELEEAWIPIIGGKDTKAVLTYPNCD